MSSTIAGLDFDSYVELTCRVSGLPMAAARAGAHTVAESLTTACDRRASGPASGCEPRLARSEPYGRRGAGRGAVRCSRSTRRATRPACTASGRRPWRWAIGWRSVRRGVNPSPPTDSSTPCGRRVFATGDALYLPTDHTVADDVIRAADLAMVYGGQDVVDRYAARSEGADQRAGPHQDPDHRGLRLARLPRRDRRLDRQPGRDGVRQRHRGAVRGRRRAALAHAIAERLSTIEPLPNTDERPFCQRLPSTRRGTLADHLAAKAAGAVAVLGADQVVADLGGRVRRRCARPCTCWTTPDPAKLNVELPLPAVSGCHRGHATDGIVPLRNSLVLNAITTTTSWSTSW